MHNEQVLPLILILLVALPVAGCVGQAPKVAGNTTPLVVSEAAGLHQQGLTAYIQGNYTEALDLYNQAIAADPGYVTAWMNKGNVLLQMNRSQEAIDAYDHALSLDRNLSVVWNRRGEALMTTGNYSAALDSFDTALRIDPDLVQAAANRELALKKLQ